MLNLFKKKKFLPILEYPESWSIIEEAPNLTLVRINMGYKDAMGHPDYPIKMGIAIPVEVHDESTMKIKGEIEDILNDILLKKGDGALVAIITGLEGQKFIEFLSYTKRGGINFAKIHQDLKDKFKDYEIQMYANNDVKWEAFKSFAHL
ncbi:MAG TPA: hypothetical protein VIM16_04910 [Mucilaginibacter sp.]|jgi:hypothetical protein